MLTKPSDPFTRPVRAPECNMETSFVKLSAGVKSVLKEIKYQRYRP